MKLNKYAGPAMLLLTAMVWGAAFVAQSVGLNYVGPFTLNSVRFLVAGVFLLPCIALVRMAIQNFSKNPVISTVSGLVG